MRWRPRSVPVASLALAVALGGACGVTDPDGYDDERDRLAENRERWSSHGFDSYDYVLQPLCFCAVRHRGT